MRIHDDFPMNRVNFGFPQNQPVKHIGVCGDTISHYSVPALLEIDLTDCCTKSEEISLVWINQTGFGGFEFELLGQCQRKSTFLVTELPWWIFHAGKAALKTARQKCLQINIDSYAIHYPTPRSILPTMKDLSKTVLFTEVHSS